MPQASFDCLCFSHLRWDFVYQRPQHLLSRLAATNRVFYVEEPIFDADAPRFEVDVASQGVRVVRMHLPASSARVATLQARLLDELLARYQVRDYAAWYYTPTALAFTGHLEPIATVYDCMDELSAFKGAPRGLQAFESDLLEQADVVFTGGHSLYEARKNAHSNVHLFPSSVDAAHFGKARCEQADPLDQAFLPHPRLGFFGVLDERLDTGLLDAMATAHPEWQLLFIGPLAKIEADSLPQHPNISYLGKKQYADLPAYIAGWDVAILPFALNASTKYISPTKVPEYLAAGKRVVSTPIHDVVRSYSELGLVAIGDGPAAFIAACEDAIGGPTRDWLLRVDDVLQGTSWDDTWQRMYDLILEAVAAATKQRQSASLPTI